MEIKSLESTNFETIFKAFNQAFIDYEIQKKRELILILRNICLRFRAKRGISNKTNSKNLN
jgi:hypothetical protein